MNDFMKDRYGVDELTCVLGGAGMLLALIGTIANLDPLTWIAGGPTASAAPNIEYERAKRTAQKMWKERKTSRFLKCPNCGQILSVPKGKGKLRVTCPRCRAKMETKS